MGETASSCGCGNCLDNFDKLQEERGREGGARRKEGREGNSGLNPPPFVRPRRISNLL